MSKGEIISIKEVQELTPMGNKKYEYIIDAGEGIGTRGERHITFIQSLIPSYCVLIGSTSKPRSVLSMMVRVP